MLKYNCLIVEDEPLAAEVLADYTRQVPFLELKAFCTDALYATEVLKKEKIDCIFLDIHLPGLKGLEFLETLTELPAIIITSAYPEYALQAFDLCVTDYLLKPFRFTRFLKAVNKLQQAAKESGMRPYHFFNVDKKMVKLFEDEILFVESLRDYVRISTPRSSIQTKLQLTEVHALLGAEKFLRVHRSFIVAKDKITAFTAADIEIEDSRIPIGRSYKEAVINELGR